MKKLKAMVSSQKNFLKLAVSPCPNDIYTYGPWIQKWTEGPEIQWQIFDLDSLLTNLKTLQFDIIKSSSYAALAYLHHYEIAPLGASFANPFGPKLVTKSNFSNQLNTPQTRIVVPSFESTSFAICKMFFPLASYQEASFRDIPSLVQNGMAEAGCLINESKWNLKKWNLVEREDLGLLWQTRFTFPLPLGCLLVKASLPEELKKSIYLAIQKSLLFSQMVPEKIDPLVAFMSADKNLQSNTQHIQNYVRNQSDLPTKVLFQKFQEALSS
jgi:1,4-dihydroxy-6-naphthoate synthase